MRYYIIAGEASGDLHAAQLVNSLRQTDDGAVFRGIGGEKMAAAGVELTEHYSTLAYMGFVQVALHLPHILRRMAACKADLEAWGADALILVDYPGFNLRMASFATKRSLCPVFYYIAPKIWAWKEGRIRQIRQYVTEMFSILPFEVDYFKRRHDYAVSYVGNPSLDEVVAYNHTHPADALAFAEGLHLDRRPVLALLPGSRRAEIAANLPAMLRAVAVAGIDVSHNIVVAAAPNIDEELYVRVLRDAKVAFRLRGKDEAMGATPEIVLHRGDSFALLQHAQTALVTSGTATLETALFGVPQIVCYAMRGGRLVNWLRPLLLKVPFIALPNLILQREIVPELVAADMAVERLAPRLKAMVAEGTERRQQLSDYEELRRRLGEVGAPLRCAAAIVARLSRGA